MIILPLFLTGGIFWLLIRRRTRWILRGLGPAYEVITILVWALAVTVVSLVWALYWVICLLLR